MKWDRVVVAILDVREGEDINATLERLGVVFAEELEKNTNPFKRGGEVGMKTVCRYAYINNEQPEYLMQLLETATLQKHFQV